MANKKLMLNPGRQYPLVLEQSFTYEEIADAGVAVKVGSLPANAVVLSGFITTTTPFGAGKTVNVGVTGAPTALGAALDVAANGMDPLVTTGAIVAGKDIFVTPVAAMTVGAATLYVTYVLKDRANEVNP